MLSKSFAFFFTMKGDEHLAEELTQDTFYKAFLNIHKFRGDSSIYSWLCQIAKNNYFNEYKRSKRFVNMEAASNYLDPSSFLDKLEDKEEALYILSIIHTLSNPYKEVFILRVFGELKFKDISNLYGKSHTWAKVTYYRAKEKIIRKVENKNEN